MRTNPAHLMESYLTWLRRRVAQAVEAGEVPAGLMAELQSEIEAAKERPQDEGHATAIRQIADLAGVDPEKAAKVLATLVAQPTVTREPLMRRIAEAWLAGQSRTHDREGL